MIYDKLLNGKTDGSSRSGSLSEKAQIVIMNPCDPFDPVRHSTVVANSPSRKGSLMAVNYSLNRESTDFEESELPPRMSRSESMFTEAEEEEIEEEMR